MRMVRSSNLTSVGGPVDDERVGGVVMREPWLVPRDANGDGGTVLVCIADLAMAVLKSNPYASGFWTAAGAPYIECAAAMTSSVD